MEVENPIVNRACLVLAAKQPFVDWINSLPSKDDYTFTLEEVNEDSTAYLIPDYDDDEERDKILEVLYEDLFEEQLAGWRLNVDDWPEISWKRFHEWFDVECRSLVLDLMGDFPLMHEK